MNTAPPISYALSQSTPTPAPATTDINITPEDGAITGAVGGAAAAALTGIGKYLSDRASDKRRSSEKSSVWSAEQIDDARKALMKLSGEFVDFAAMLFQPYSQDEEEEEFVGHQKQLYGTLTQFRFAAAAARPVAEPAMRDGLREAEEHIDTAVAKLMLQLGRRAEIAESFDSVQREIQPIVDEYQTAQGSLLNQYGKIRSRYRAAAA